MSAPAISLIQTDLNDTQEFWKAIFQQTRFTCQLIDVETSKMTDFNFKLPNHGEVQINIKPAVPLGTNFMSDVYIANASLKNGKQYAGFVKVKKIIIF